MENDILEKIMKCPWCKEDVKYGDMIWLNGDCLCPNCYNHKRAQLDLEIERRIKNDRI